MTKIRLVFILLTLFVVGGLGFIATLYARGYRLNPETLKVSPSGILVLKSDPEGAQVFVNGELKTATNSTISLSPASYDINIKKDGFIPWTKKILIEKEIVTEIDASLFKSTPALSPLTFSGCLNPKISPDYTKIAFVIPPSGTQEDVSKIGLWIVETLNLPLGFARDPRRITDGDLTDATWEFSPSGREILLTTKQGVYLLDTGSFISQGSRTNIISKLTETLKGWEKERTNKLSGQTRNLPEELTNILNQKAKSVVFSPDENKVLYVASGSASLKSNLIQSLPGSSTQKEERDIKDGKTYVYDIKEDRNFIVTDQEVTPIPQIISQSASPSGALQKTSSPKKFLSWFPNSKNLILAEDGKVTIMDYDGTNRQVVYSGNYVFPYAFPFVNTGKIIILTNLGANSSLPNLYSLSLK